MRQGYWSAPLAAPIPGALTCPTKSLKAMCSWEASPIIAPQIQAPARATNGGLQTLNQSNGPGGRGWSACSARVLAREKCLRSFVGRLKHVARAYVERTCARGPTLPSRCARLLPARPHASGGAQRAFKRVDPQRAGRPAHKRTRPACGRGIAHLSAPDGCAKSRERRAVGVSCQYLSELRRTMSKRVSHNLSRRGTAHHAAPLFRPPLGVWEGGRARRVGRGGLVTQSKSREPDDRATQRATHTR